MKRKRFIALILAIVMTIGMFPVYTSAEEGASAAPTVPGETVPVTTAASETVPATTAAPSVVQETTPVTTTAPATTEPATEPAAVPTIVPEETNAPVDNCPYCEDSTAEDGTVIHGANCNAAYVYDGTADVGRYVQLIPAVAEAGVIVSGDPASDPDGISFFYDEFGADTVMRITEWYWDAGTTGLWYRVELHSGAFPESTADYSWPGTPWILQDYTDTTYEWDAVLEFVTVEEEPGETEPEATTPTERIQCGICGSYDCTALHFYCDICEAYDCGKPHLYCNLCEAYDCTAEHIWCGSCGSHDCGLEHEDLHTPVTAPVIPEAPTLPEGEEVSIVDAQGNPVEGLLLRQGEKTSLSAWSGLETASYQWQVRYDGNRDLWTDIHGQTGKGILISPAMFLSILDAQGTAAIRCVVSAGGEKKISEAISVAMAEQSVVLRASAPAYGALDSDSGVMPLAGDTDNKVNLIINYKFTNGTIAANPWAATLPAGEPYSTGSTPITIPTIAGYTPVVDGAAGEATTLDGYQLRLNLSAEQLTQDLTLNIVYQASEVAVTVLHYWQNVNDDNYTLHKTAHLSLVTENQVGDVHESYEGFYNLLYERPFVAADGSTVVEVYYDRYYYLIKFDLGGGYGVDPIYARYGTELEVPDPTKAGYSFAGWTPDIPDTLPVGGGTYHAQWKPLGNTPYTVAYWIVNDDGSRTLIGSQIKRGVSGGTVNGTNDLANAVICGEEKSHTHTADCYNCGIAEEHSHTQSCFNKLDGNKPGVNGRAVINAIGEGNPKSGYVYVIKTENGNLWPKLYLNGQYYAVNGIAAFNIPATQEQVNTLIEGEALGSATVEFTEETLTATKYRANPDNCEKIQHVHTDCKTCSDHAHTAECYYDPKYVEYLENPVTIPKADGTEVTYTTSQNVTIKGDGSSVVDVYYEYRTYTIRFIYAKEDGTQYKLAKSTGNGHLSESNGCVWDYTVNSLPSVTDPSGKTQPSAAEIDGVTYYYISLTAKFGADIADAWPSAHIDPVDDYSWGSWAAAPGTGYRKTYGDAHANIVGPYPTMSAEMIVDNPDKLADGSYLAQNMVAWWGASSDNVGSHAYHIYVELLPAEKENRDPNATYATFKNLDTGVEKEYRLVDTYTFTAAHNGNTRVDPIIFTGLVCVNDTANDSDKNSDLQADSKNFPSDNCDICKRNNCNYHNNFFYDRNIHMMYFWNYNDFLTDGKGSDVAFGSSLVKHGEYVDADFMAKPEYYPDGLEPGAFKFAGWYTTADCLDGTEMDWNSTMPDADMTVYAKWVPVTRRVRFFLSEASMTAGKTIPEEMKELWKEEYDTAPYPQNSPYDTKFATLTAVTNNTYLPDLSDPGVTDSGDAYFQKIHPYAGYDFMGWFYVNEAGEEAAFDPENMPVTRDLDLYAKWGSNMLCPYEIYFALDDNKDGKADTGTDGKPIYVADPITGSALAGNSRTFDAKGDTALYAAYQNGYFPNVPSHTIILQIRDEDGEPGQDLTTFTFLYHPEESVPYTVRYLKAGTGDQLAEMETFSDNTKAVVTENFKPIPGYIPDAYQKTLVVVPSETTNEIIFYYTQDTQHALYQVNHYIQNLDGETWSEYSTSTITGNIGTDYSASAISITGYDFSDQHTNRYNLTDKKNPYTGVDLPGEVNFSEDTDTVSGKLTGNGMQLNLYYTRQVYTYKVRYLEYGTDQVLHDEKTGTAKYNQLVSENAVEIQKDLDGDGKIEDFRLYEATQDPQTATIRDNSTVLTFYYVRCTQTMTITKRVVHNVVDSDQEFEFSLKIHAGGYHRNSYTYKKTGGDTGILYPEASEPTLLRFTLKAGETITIEGLPTAEYTVQEENVPPCYDVSYFPAKKNTLTVNSALDVTVTNTYATTLTITKKVDSVLEAQQSFIFTVRRAEKDLNMRVIITIPAGEDSGSVTLAEIPMGQYTIEEEESWSWRYGDNSKNITLGDERSYNVEITNTRTNPYWLSSADANKNIFVGTP